MKRKLNHQTPMICKKLRRSKSPRRKLRLQIRILLVWNPTKVRRRTSMSMYYWKTLLLPSLLQLRITMQRSTRNLRMSPTSLLCPRTTERKQPLSPVVLKKRRMLHNQNQKMIQRIKWNLMINPRMCKKWMNMQLTSLMPITIKMKATKILLRNQSCLPKAPRIVPMSSTTRNCSQCKKHLVHRDLQLTTKMTRRIRPQ